MDLVDCLRRSAQVKIRQGRLEKSIHLDSSDPECCSSSDEVVGMSSFPGSSLLGAGSRTSTSIDGCISRRADLNTVSEGYEIGERGKWWN